MPITRLTRPPGYEDVLACSDPDSGLHAIIAIHSTVRGRALGGTRFYPYADQEAALADVLRLSRAMSYKAACAGLELGGAKAVIIGDPRQDKTDPLLHAYGRMVDSLEGRYYTACDVGTESRDMDIVAQECRYVTGRSVALGGSGDSAVLTAYGVFRGMRAAAAHVWGASSLRGRRIGVSGVGKVGSRLVEHLLADDACVVVADVRPSAIDRIRAAYPDVEVDDPDKLVALPLDIYAPCALAGALDEETVGAMQADVVCGAANNQLAHPEVDRLLYEHGIVYVPDYMVNAGGLIQVADEIDGYCEARARERTSQVFDTVCLLLGVAEAEGTPTGQAADRLAERRMADLRRQGAPGTCPATGDLA